MQIPLDTLNTLLANGAILLQLGAVALVLLLWRGSTSHMIFRLAERYGLFLAFLVALLGMIGSLYYSEVLGILPCGLCWFQRVFLYPLVPILGYAAWKRDTSILPYVLLLCFFGGVVALYQHALQIGISSGLPCPASAEGADCTKRFIFEYGYITFPLIAFSSFAFIAALTSVAGKRRGL